MKKHIIKYSRSRANIHIAIRAIAMRAFNTQENLDEFANAINYELKEFGSSTHAKREQTTPSVRFEKHIDGRSCTCEFVTQSKGRQVIFECGLPNIDKVRELEAKRIESQAKLDEFTSHEFTDYFIIFGLSRQIGLIDEKIAELQKKW